MTNNSVLSRIFSVLLAVAASGCGGGGGSGAGSQTTTSHFIDAPVAGLTYVASPSNTTGITSSTGAFNYQSGDSVSLYLGGSAGVEIMKFSPVSGNDVHVVSLPNWDTLSMLLLTLDGASGSSANMDVSTVQNIDSSRITISTLLSENRIDSATLGTIKSAVTSSNLAHHFKNSTLPTKADAYSHVIASLTNVSATVNSKKSASFFQMETTDTGVNTGEILNGFRADVGKTSYHIASSDDSYIEYTNATNFVYSTPVIGTFDTWNINDTYSSTSSTISCPSRITFKSSIDDGNGYVQMFEQNYTETSLDCEQKNLTQFNYAIDTSLGVSTLSGKTLSFTQRCGASNNSFSIAVAIDASYTVTGTICSIKQQDSTAVNARTETNIVIANGGAVDASNIAGVVRFLPTGYTHAAGQLVFALAKSVDGSRYYFTLSDGGSPGQLAGGLVKATLN